MNKEYVKYEELDSYGLANIKKDGDKYYIEITNWTSPNNYEVRKYYDEGWKIFVEGQMIENMNFEDLAVYDICLDKNLKQILLTYKTKE